jgi:thiol-disulfide isomerase/thioredoxin
VYTTSPRGKRTFWIDAENYTLRRMEVPIEADMQAIDPEHQYSQLAIWIDFEDSAFNTPIDNQVFEKTIAASDHRVRRFVPPPPAAPPEALGKPLAEFEFQTLDGKPVAAKDFAGKTVLLDFWQIECPPCKAQTPTLEQLYQELKKETNFAWFAVDVEEARIPAETLTGTLERWGGTMPILRDPRGDAWEKIKIDRTPTLLLLDSQGRLQFLRSEDQPDAKVLGSVIRRVIAGADLAAEARAEHAQLVKDYDRELASVTINDEATLQVEVPQPQPAERKLPEKFAAAELWHADPDDIAHPGYVLSVNQPGEGAKSEPKPSFLVLDGGDAVVEFDAEGARLDRHEIYSTGENANGFLRASGGGSDGRRLAVSGVGWQKVRIFDGNWKQVLEFPKDRHPGIADVQFAPDQDPAKARLVVGYWGGVGLQGVGFDGQRKWSQRALEQVVQVAFVPGENGGPRELWCTSNRGSISVLDEQGKPRRVIHVGSSPLMYFAWNKTPDGNQEAAAKDAAFCGLALEGVGHYQAVGFTRNGEVTWRFPLPAGEYVQQVDRIQSVELPGKKSAWMIAAADGTIYWLDNEGKLIDKFPYGRPLTGLSLTNTADAAILLVSIPNKLTAWKLTEKK